MKPEFMPMIRVQVEGIQASIIHCFSGFEEAMESAVSEAIEKAMANLGIEAAEAARRHVREELDRKIGQAAASAVNELVYSADFNAEIRRRAIAALEK